MLDLLPQIRTLAINNQYDQFNHIKENDKPFLPNFYGPVGNVRRDITTLSRMIHELENMQYDVINTGKKNLALPHSDINKLSHRIYIQLEKIKQSNTPKQSDTINRIICNIHTALSESFSETRHQYYSIKDRYDTEIQKFFIDHVDAESQTNMDRLELMMTLNKLDSANQTHNYVIQRHKEIIKLEKDLQSVNQLFIDMAALVDRQGEVIDRISYRVSNAKEYVEEAKVELTDAYRIKKRICLIQ